MDTYSISDTFLFNVGFTRFVNDYDADKMNGKLIGTCVNSLLELDQMNDYMFQELTFVRNI